MQEPALDAVRSPLPLAPRGILLLTLISAGLGGTQAVRAQLPPSITVTEHGGVDRTRFPVQGAIPLPPGALRDVARLRLMDRDARVVPAQFGVHSRWTDRSVKWLSLDFPSSQPARSTTRYRLVSTESPGETPASLVSREGENVAVDTGPLRARFGPGGSSVAIRGRDGKWAVVVTDVVSLIGIRGRGVSNEEIYELPLTSIEVELDGHQRAVLVVRGWHAAAGGQTYSPSVVRLSFYRDQSFVKIDHTFVVSRNPDEHHITDVALDVRVATSPTAVVFGHDGVARRIGVGTKRLALVQENPYSPRYPDLYEEREFEGAYRVLKGDAVLARGERYDGAVTFEGAATDLGVYIRDFWQLSPKSISFDPEAGRLRLGLYPGEFVGPLDLKRTELKNPAHYRDYRRSEGKSWGKYPPTYVPHDLVHSAMGISRTHTLVLWFGVTGRVPGPIELHGMFESPFVPFVSGAWNVGTGVLGKEVAPGARSSEAEDTARRMVAEQRRAIEDGGWYGLFTYGNVRYGWDKTRRRWMKYHPKYAWYHAGHMMSGGTLQQALWHHYLRSGDPRDYRLAEARGRYVLDVAVNHYHEQKEWVGSMLRHGGPDPFIGHRKIGGGHYPIAGLPIHYCITGDTRAADVVHLLGGTNYRRCSFDLGRNQDTDLANMTLYYEFTLDRRYHDRAAELVAHYYDHREEAARERTFFNYFTTAARLFYRVSDDPVARRKLKAVFLSRYDAHLDERRLPGNPEMAAFAYELRPGPEAARRVRESVETFVRQGSGQIGWYDNMLLVSPNEMALINAAAYAGYWLSRFEPAEPAEPAEFSRLGEAVEEEAIAPDLPRDGLAAWFRSDRGVHAVGARVVRWDDLSGNDRHALAGRRWGRRGPAGPLREREASAPLIVPDAVGGLPVLRGGGGRYLRLRRFVALDGDCSIFFVCSAEAGDSGPVLGDGDDGGIRIEEVPRGRLSVRFNVGVTGVHARLKGDHPPGGFARWGIARRGRSVSFYQDGEPLGVRELEAVTPMNVEVLMARRVWTDPFRGELCELLIYDRCLEDEERAAVNAYLGRRYGRLDLVQRPTGLSAGESGELVETEESEETERTETESTGEDETGAERRDVLKRLRRSRARLQRLRHRLEQLRRSQMEKSS